MVALELEVMTARPLSAVVLAAGEGTRMRSVRPKPLHLLCGRAMLLYVLDALGQCEPQRAVIVVGHGAERVTKKLQEEAPDLVLDFVEQHVQRGTGDAVSVGLTGFTDDDLDDDGDVVVLPGDTPLLRPETIAALVRTHRESEAACTLLTARMDDPTGYGRVVRGKDGRVRQVVEEADATDEEREIDEVNTSIYCFRRSVLAPALRRLSPENAQGEYYLTDVIAVLHDAGYPVVSLVAGDAGETQGVNDRVQLAQAEAELRRRTNERWLRLGVTMLDPERTYIDTTVRAGHRRHPVPRHPAPGPLRGGRRGRARARHPPGGLRGGRRGRGRAHRRARRRGRASGPSSAPSPCWSRAATSRPTPAPARSTLQ